MNNTTQLVSNSKYAFFKTIGTLEIIYFMISSIGVLGNLVVIFVLGRVKELRKRRVDFLIVHQSFIDLVASSLIVPMTLPLSNRGYTNSSWDDFVCRVLMTNVPLWSCFMVSTYNIVLVTLDRLSAVVYPIWYRNTSLMVGKSKTWTLLSFLLIWTMGIGFNIMTTSLPTIVVKGQCRLMYTYPSSSLKQFSGVMIFIVQYAVPCACFLACYVMIIRRIAGTIMKDKKFKSISSTIEGQVASVMEIERKAKQSKAHRNVHITLALVVICCIICNSINQCMFLGYNFGYRINFTGYLYHASVIMVFLNCCINPIVYVCKYEAFQKALIAMITCKKSIGKPDVYISTEHTKSTSPTTD